MIHTGDCIQVMAGMEPESVDAIVTDPPYGLEFMGKEWDRFGRGEAQSGATAIFSEDGMGKGFRALPSYLGGLNPRCKVCGKSQRGGSPCRCEHPQFTNEALPRLVAYQAWTTEWATEALRVTKPGGYLLAFGGTRTHHRLVCGLEDAGWIIRDELTWVYASGFPKGKANLKPAHEPIVLARKPGPLRPLGIDAGRIGTDELKPYSPGLHRDSPASFNDDAWQGREQVKAAPSGRWPSNVLLDPDSAELFDEPNPEVVGSGAVSMSGSRTGEYDGSGSWSGPFGPVSGDIDGDSGGYSRFFLVPKSSRSDREPVVRGTVEPTKGGSMSGAETRPDRPTNHPIRENAHPTVKPVDLMRHLIRLVTPTGGTVLDCFAGSGSTLIAAELEGFAWIGIEKEPEYVAIAEARLNGTQRGLGLDVGAPIRKRTIGEGTYPKGRAYSKGEMLGLKTEDEPAA